jgi:hypothetical protein
MVKVIYEKEVETEEGKTYEKVTDKSKATHKQLTYPETKREMNQEKPGRRIKL